MKLSLNWIKQYTKVDVSVDELVAKIGSQLGEVEEVASLAPKYEAALIVKIISCIDHPNADRLHVCKVDDGGVAQNVARDEQGMVEVVCGAPNVHADMLAVWLPPGATVPASFDKEPFVLEARELRGVVSNGMLASPKELALGDSHEGILEIDPTEWSPKQQDIRPGANFGQVFGLNDTIIDIENKMFTHRPDLFGQLGLAREVAGIQGEQFTSPDWYAKAAAPQGGKGLELTVVNEAPELVPRLMAVAIKNVTVKPSPLWLQCELVRVGGKPINNIVDVTNYIMWLTAQPTHAYDYDKLRGHTLVARRATKGETAELLNGKTYSLTTDDIAIADAEGPIGLGGIMGGGNSEVSNDTVNIVLECANFDMYAVRRSSMRQGVFTDALTRFSKGQSPLQNNHVLQLLMQSIGDVAGGEVASPIFDEYATLPELPTVTVTASFINSRLGLQLTPQAMTTSLQNVEFLVTTSDDSLTVTAPFWRTDIAIAEDIVEEIGRLYGYDQLPLNLPHRDITPAAVNALMQFKDKVRTSLATAGANELLTYSFVPGDLLQKVGQNPEEAFKIGNALSPDLQYYRFSGLASLLDKVHSNIKAGHDRFTLFELSKGHSLQHQTEDGRGEAELLDIVFASKKPLSGAPFYQVRRYVQTIADDLGIAIDFRPVTDSPTRPDAMPYDHHRTAKVYAAGTDHVLGLVGELTSAVRRNLKLPAQTAGATLSLTGLLKACGSGAGYQPLSRYPKVEQDICFRVAADLPYGELAMFVQEQLQTAKAEHTSLQIEPLDIYQRSEEPEHKQVTFRITLTSYQKTMTDAEVTSLLQTLTEQAGERFNAERI